MATSIILSILNTKTIKIIKRKEPRLMWYAIYADDIEVCDIFGEHPATRLPTLYVSSPEEETSNTPSDTERTPENAE